MGTLSGSFLTARLAEIEVVIVIAFFQERLPLFDCDTFEVLREREGFTVVVLLRCCQCKIEADMRFVQNFIQPEF